MHLILRAALVNAVAVLPAFAQATRDAPPRAGALRTDPVPLCRANQVSIRLDGRDGDYAGMSQNGTDLVLRNISTTACRVPAIPAFTLSDVSGVVHATPKVPGTRFMHPGPVVAPIVVAAGTELTSTLHWIAGPVFDHNVCRTPTTLAMVIGGETKRVPFGSQICGDRAEGGLSYDVTRFAPDSVRRQ